MLGSIEINGGSGGGGWSIKTRSSSMQLLSSQVVLL